MSNKRAEEILETYLKPLLADFRLVISVYERKFGNDDRMMFHVGFPGSFENLYLACEEDSAGNLKWFAGKDEIPRGLVEWVRSYLGWLQNRYEEILVSIKDRLR